MREPSSYVTLLDGSEVKIMNKKNKLQLWLIICGVLLLGSLGYIDDVVSAVAIVVMLFVSCAIVGFIVANWIPSDE